MKTIGLYISVPIASFRIPRAREYFETFPLPPPATVYGMILSLVGEKNRRIYEGTELAIALLSEPEYSVVLRTVWRVKSNKYGLGLGENKRPDFQELLTDIRLAVWIRNGTTAENSLIKRLENAFSDPSAISRFGGLALGESTHLVNEVQLMDKFPCQTCQFLLKDDDGELSLPIWADHVGPETNWGQYSMKQIKFSGEVPAEAWTRIERKPTLPVS